MIAASQSQKQVRWNGLKRKDGRTGREIWQVTSHDSASEACYFEAQAFTTDDKYMVFSSKRTGEWQFYRCDLETGALMDLSNSGPVRPQIANSFSADDRYALGTFVPYPVTQNDMSLPMDQRGRPGLPI